MNARERWIVFPGLLVLGGFSFARQESRLVPQDGSFGTVTARRLKLVDDERRSRVVMEALTDDDWSSIVLFGRDGKAAAELALRPNGSPQLTLTGTEGKTTLDADGLRVRLADGKAGITLDLSHDGSPSVRLSGATAHTTLDANGVSIADVGRRVEATLALLQDGSIGLALGEKQEEVRQRAMLMLVPNGTAMLSVLGRRGHAGIHVEVAGKQGPQLTVTDNSAQGRLILALREDGSPSISVADETGNGRAIVECTSIEKTKTGAVERTAPSSLVLFDKEGKVIFRAP